MAYVVKQHARYAFFLRGNDNLKKPPSSRYAHVEEWIKGTVAKFAGQEPV